ncbi:MAG: hypothetical protein A4E34_02630 [Methanoregula sp. PtaU1.Bin006]|nr:MAG: hypothetical protein A4E33_00380 [Methanoregula sp. PtaB.Bin085]OPY32256.1 MAG: hypothetical protein A4E34_02630 [Methanoregula sp. PtaU1.Bin006]
MPVKVIDIHTGQPENTPQCSLFQLVMERNNRPDLPVSSWF